MLQGHGDSPLLWVDEEDAGVDPPCAARAGFGHSQPPHPRRLFALESKGKSGRALRLPALNPPTPPELWRIGRCKVSLLSPAPDGYSPEMAAVLSLTHTMLQL